MSITSIYCPHCKRVGKTSKVVPAGAKIRCPGCGETFTYEPQATEGYELEPVEIPAPVRPAPLSYPDNPPPLRPSNATRPVVAVAPVQAVQVVVPEPRRGNALAITALVLGVMAALVSWVPLLGLVAWPVGGLAVLLGIPGLVLAIATKRPGLSASLAGMGLGVVAMFVSGAITGSMATAVSKSIE